MKLNEIFGEVRIFFQVKRLAPLSIAVLFLISYSYFLGFNPWMKIELNEFKTAIEEYKESNFENSCIYGNIDTKNHNLKVSSLFSIEEDMVIYKNFILLLLLLPTIIHIPRGFEWLVERLFKYSSNEKERIKIIQEIGDISASIFLVILIVFLDGLELILYMLKDIDFPLLMAIIPILILSLYINDLLKRINELNL